MFSLTLAVNARAALKIFRCESDATFHGFPPMT
jgi:hypothetical protein